VRAGARQGAARALATTNIHVEFPLADLQPEWPLPLDQHRHYALHFHITADAAAAGLTSTACFATAPPPTLAACNSPL
jgi:hypothetical protein